MNFLNDLPSIFIWWLTIFSLGLVNLPIIFVIFNKFWDSGYIFSKTFSVIVVTYLILIFGIFKILPFNLFSLFLLVFFFIIFDVFFLLQKKRYLIFFQIVKQKYKVFIFQEILFLVILTVWSFVRGFAPSIEGLEKYMDWGFINSALRSQYLPPQDMWFSGFSINYYYFGHLIFALITKLSNIPSSITYNLSIATVCALTFVSSLSLASNFVFCFFKKVNFKKVILAGLISATLLTFGGNLHPIYKISKLNYTQNNNKLIFTQDAINKSIDAYWYPDATRFIGHDPDVPDKTIHEFPLYSFVVSDLHGHMNDIFIVLFFLSFLLVSFLSVTKFFDWKFIIFSGFILSVCYMTNAWDFAIYGLMLAIFTLLINFKNEGFNSLTKTIFNGGLVIIFWYLFSLPFSLNFVPMMEGIKIATTHSPFYQLFILYGGFWLICLPFILFFIIKKPKSVSDYFVFSLILTATILVLIPEVIYIKDIYIFEYRRANTMFKLVYQAFILYSLASGYILIRLSNVFYRITFCLIFYIQLIYPYFAIKSYYNNFIKYQGSDGFKYLQELYPDNYKAILWINKNISGQPVMLEAVGDSYTTFNQVSSSTGLPTVQGWVVHEWLWRGGYDAPKARQDDVEKIYTSKNIQEVKDLISKYKIKYIFVGDKEFEKYPNLNQDNFLKLGGKIIFQSGKTAIFQL